MVRRPHTVATRRPATSSYPLVRCRAPGEHSYMLQAYTALSLLTQLRWVVVMRDMQVRVLLCPFVFTLFAGDGV